MKYKKYCVTVMDNWTPIREFWTFNGAWKHFKKHKPVSYLWFWNKEYKCWQENLPGIIARERWQRHER